MHSPLCTINYLVICVYERRQQINSIDSRFRRRRKMLDGASMRACVWVSVLDKHVFILSAFNRNKHIMFGCRRNSKVCIRPGSTGHFFALLLLVFLQGTGAFFAFFLLTFCTHMLRSRFPNKQTAIPCVLRCLDNRCEKTNIVKIIGYQYPILNSRDTLNRDIVFYLKRSGAAHNSIQRLFHKCNCCVSGERDTFSASASKNTFSRALYLTHSLSLNSLHGNRYCSYLYTSEH